MSLKTIESLLLDKYWRTDDPETLTFMKKMKAEWEWFLNPEPVIRVTKGEKKRAAYIVKLFQRHITAAENSINAEVALLTQD
jgi:hypothetical protein